MTDSSHSLSPIQNQLLVAFFEREDAFVLTGGAALVGFYLKHRDTKDLDLFAGAGADIDRAERALADAALSLGAAWQSCATSGNSDVFWSSANAKAPSWTW